MVKSLEQRCEFAQITILYSYTNKMDVFEIYATKNTNKISIIFKHNNRWIPTLTLSLFMRH